MWFIFFYSYWDSAYDSDVMEDSVGLNLLYAQVWYVFVPFEVKQDVIEVLFFLFYFVANSAY